MNTMLLVITVVSLALAAVSATIAWQVTQADRRRRMARVTALAEAAGVDAMPHPAIAADAAALPESALADTVIAPGGVAMADRFLAADTSGSGSAGRQSSLIGAAMVVAALVAAIGVATFVGNRRTGGAQAAAVMPLELLSLSHQRVDGTLTVSGLVRNPPSGVRVDQLEAEVRVFDPAGILVATRSGLVGALELDPGQESPFAISLGESATAARYRVSFRTAGTMRPHVDHRTNPPASVDFTAEAR